MAEETNDSAQDFMQELNRRIRQKLLQKPRKAASRMDQVEKVLPAVLSKLGLDRRLREHALMQVWASLLPGALAELSRPLFIDHQHNLVIAVSNASVAQELSLMKSKLMRALLPTAKSLGIELTALRMDMKHFHRLEEKSIEPETPLPQANDNALAAVALSDHDIQLMGELSQNLSADLSDKTELAAMVLRVFEKQLRLAAWRRQHAYPICQLCKSPVTRLFAHGLHKVCFNCLVSE